MCGIAGIVNLGEIFSATELESIAGAMRDCMTNRGPADSGVWFSIRAGARLRTGDTQ